MTNGVNTVFSIGASGNAPLTYQWRFNGTNLPGATGQSLPLLNVQRRHGGVYSVQVSNAFDVAVSSNATLTVLVPPIQILGTGTSFSAPGHFTLNFTGDSNTVFAIETSTNLLDWTQTGTVTNITGTVLYDDGTAGSSPYRFYRLRIVP